MEKKIRNAFGFGLKVVLKYVNRKNGFKNISKLSFNQFNFKVIIRYHNLCDLKLKTNLD